MLPEELNTLVQSAKAGDTNAAAQLNNIGWEYQFGNNGHTVDQALAYQLYAISAECGDFNGMNNAGYCISNGIGIEKDLNKAFEYFKHAAELGHWGGMSNLGWCYMYGNGVEKDVEKAIHWLTRAAEEGNNIWSMNRLTEIYGELDGYVHYEQAAKWFLTLIQKDCDPNSGVYEQTGYNKDLYEKVKNAILNSASESELSSLSGSSSGGSLLGRSISVVSSNAKSYINQAEELLTKKNYAEKEKIISLIEKDYGVIRRDPFQSPLGNFVIPEGTRRIGEHVFSSGKDLTSIIIPNTVTSIGNGAFSSCSSLTSITIPDSVTSIGGSAFMGCSSLASIVIGSGVTSIGYWAFSDCTSLTSVTICDGVKNIGEYAFSGCDSLTSIHIPSSVITFEAAAFFECKGLTTVFMDGTTSIGESAFSGCESLASIFLGDKVTSIGKCAFKSCKGLTSIIIPDSVASIGSCAFMNCESLAGVKLGKGVFSIGKDAFRSCPIQNIIVPRGTRQRFENMEGLKGLESKIIEE